MGTEETRRRAEGAPLGAVGAERQDLPPPKTAAVLVIGNELLSGKVEEANVVVLAKALRSLGVSLRRVVMVLDDIPTIATEVKALASTHDWLFTSGGVGPTHDDVTVEGVASAFGRTVHEDPVLAQLLHEHYQERITPGHLRMALVPSGAALEVSPEVRWPTIRVENTFLLPGVPEIFRMKLPVALACIGAAQPFVSRVVYTKMDEGDLKVLLDAVVARFPDVEVGSYPKWQNPTYKTKLTFDGRDGARVDAARDAFVALLPPGEPQPLD